MVKNCDNCGRERHSKECQYCVIRCFEGNQISDASEWIPPENPYWKNICTIAEKQRAKGIETYGQGIEKNPADAITRIEYLQEELIDALMYCEWIKDSIRNVGEIDFDYNAEDV